MDFLHWFCVTFTLYHIIKILLICLRDCDVATTLAELYGNRIDTLKNKVIWITGTSSGIGKELALICAKVGSKLVLSARRLEELEKVKESCIEASNGLLTSDDILILPMDISDLTCHQVSLGQVINRFGRLDILVNNAGRSQRANWAEIDIEVDKSMFRTNVFGPVNLSNVCGEYFLYNGGGHIAVTSSVTGIIPFPYSCSYTASKHALHGFFNTFRHQPKFKNTTISIFCPGPTFTNFLQESYTGKVDEKFGIPTKPTDKRLTVERCSHLYAVVLANKLNESWAGLFPMVPFMYIKVNYPNMFRLIEKIYGPNLYVKMRDGSNLMKTD